MPGGTVWVAASGRPTPGITIHDDHRKRQESNLHPPPADDGARSR